MNICKIDDCHTPVKNNVVGICAKHYARMRRAGTLPPSQDRARVRVFTTLEPDFIDKVAVLRDNQVTLDDIAAQFGSGLRTFREAFKDHGYGHLLSYRPPFTPAEERRILVAIDEQPSFAAAAAVGGWDQEAVSRLARATIRGWVKVAPVDAPTPMSTTARLHAMRHLADGWDRDTVSTSIGVTRPTLDKFLARVDADMLTPNRLLAGRWVPAPGRSTLVWEPYRGHAAA